MISRPIRRVQIVQSIFRKPNFGSSVIFPTSSSLWTNPIALKHFIQGFTDCLERHQGLNWTCCSRVSLTLTAKCGAHRPTNQWPYLLSRDLQKLNFLLVPPVWVLQREITHEQKKLSRVFKMIGQSKSSIFLITDLWAKTKHIHYWNNRQANWIDHMHLVAPSTDWYQDLILFRVHRTSSSVKQRWTMGGPRRCRENSFLL